MFQRAALLATVAASLFFSGVPAALAYQDAEDGYAIDFPGKWTKKDHYMGTSVIALSPLESSRDRFADNVNVVVEDFGQTIPLATYTKASLDNLGKFLNGYKLVEKKATLLAGKEATRIVYEHAQGEYKLRALVYLIVDGTKGYVLTCTAERASYSKFAGQFDQICHTFAITEAAPAEEEGTEPEEE